jgi:hypothetical protein
MAAGPSEAPKSGWLPAIFAVVALITVMAAVMGGARGSDNVLFGDFAFAFLMGAAGYAWPPDWKTLRARWHRSPVRLVLGAGAVGWLVSLLSKPPAGWCAWAAVAGVLGAAVFLLLGPELAIERWTKTAETRGLRHQRRTLFHGNRLEGTIGGARVVVKERQVRLDAVAEVADPRIPPISVSQELRLHLGSHATGDDEFDRVFRVQGAEADWRAALGPDARRFLLVYYGTVHGRKSPPWGSVDGGVVSRAASEPEEAIARAIELANAIALPPGGIDEALAMRLRDEIPPLRLRCLELLLARPPSEWWQVALRPALGDSEPATRLLAARHSGPHGFEVAKSIVFGDHGDELRIEALAIALASGAAPEAVEELLQRAAAHGPSAEVCVAAIRAIGERADRAALEGVLPRAPRLAPIARAALADTIGRFADPAWEEPLLALLGDEESAVRAAAARALGACGTARSVGALRQQGSAGAKAIHEIQERLGKTGAEAGQLDIADPSGEGDLSLPDAPGALSIAGTASGDEAQGPPRPIAKPQKA